MADAFAKYEVLASSLPAAQTQSNLAVREYGGFWYPSHLMAPSLAVQDMFVARPTDVILATLPKSGTTWLKALVFCVQHRDRHAPADNERHPLLAASPHDLVPFLHSLYDKHQPVAPSPLLEAMLSPRVLAVHAPFSGLPASVKESGGCRIVYLCRDPKDALVSFHYYINEIGPGRFPVVTFAETVDMFCDGLSGFGPAWNHMAEYWKESKARPAEVMFLRYEQLKEDTVGSVRRLAEFLGCPFTGDEAARGVPEAVVALCSIEKMKGVTANREGLHGTSDWSFKNTAFYRKGEVGDWKAHMTADMARRVDSIMEEKLRGTGLSVITGN